MKKAGHLYYHFEWRRKKEVVKRPSKKKKPSENRKRPSLIFNFNFQTPTNFHPNHPIPPALKKAFFGKSIIFASA
jgi:hypothetical protein